MAGRSIDPLVMGRVVGDVLDPFSPSVELKVSYGPKQVNNGVELKPSQTPDAPRVDIGRQLDNALYTLVMVDPDAPSPSEPSAREWLHWYSCLSSPRLSAALLPGRLLLAAADSSGKLTPYRSMQSCSPTSTTTHWPLLHRCELRLVTDIPSGSTLPGPGTVLMEYMGPKPPIGIHRYVFALFRQQSLMSAVGPDSRANFNTRLFAAQHDLAVPVAAVYFNAQKETASSRRR
eukprot:SM000005S17207  [mRNA]  locus=s5:790799:791982:+ [translate_table: standard]